MSQHAVDTLTEFSLVEGQFPQFNTLKFKRLLEGLFGVPARAAGSIHLTAGFNNENNKHIYISDGVNTADVFVTNLGGGTTVGTILDTGGGASLAACVTRLRTIIEENLNFIVREADGILYLTNRRAGNAGNTTITTTATNITIVQPTGGVGEDIFHPASLGACISMTLALPNQPSTGNTVRIGNDWYQFRAAAASVTNDTYIAVLIGADAAASRANLVAAINATNATNEHASIFLIDGETPALANGTEAWLADIVGTGVRVRSAASAGSPELVGSVRRAQIAATITDAECFWNIGNNIQTDTLGGTNPSAVAPSMSEITITAAMITALGVRFSFPFDVGPFSHCIRTSTGLQRDSPATDTFTRDGGDVLLTLGGEELSDINAGDVVTVTASPA